MVQFVLMIGVKKHHLQEQCFFFIYLLIYLFIYLFILNRSYSAPETLNSMFNYYFEINSILFYFFFFLVFHAQVIYFRLDVFYLK
jgi:hypothetical protein